MADRILRVGIAGYGRSGCDIHAAWLREDAKRFRIVAVADQIAERRADARRDFQCAVYSDYSTLLRKTEMDLFINALPSFLHSPVTVEALRAGNNVVCEKPCGRTVKLFDKTVAASRRSKKLFAPFQNSRFYPFFGKMREVIGSGVLGRVLHIRSVWGGFGRRWDWQTLQDMHGGNLLNTGPHPVDHGILLFGERMPKVFCRMKSIQPFGGDAEDFCSLTLYGGREDPVIEILISSYLAYPLGDQYNISAEFGGMTGNAQGLKWKYFDPAKAPKQKFWRPWSDHRRYCSETLPWVEETWAPPASPLSAFQQLSAGFYGSIYDALANGAELIVKPEQVRRQIAVMEECHRQNPLPRRRRTR